jgi:uncharacterized protein (UPF0332 family)
MYLKNAEISLRLAEECMSSSLKPYVWTVVISYYSMFYIANAVLSELGYKIGHKIVHKVTNDALIALVMDKVKKGLLEEYENAKEDALELAFGQIRRIDRILWAGDGQEVEIPV